MSAGILSIHSRPNRATMLALSWMLFVAGAVAYLYTSAARHRDNPEDRVMPTVAQMGQGIYEAATKPAEEDAFDESAPENPSMLYKIQHSMLWKDTKATGIRFFYSLALMVPAVMLGLHMGLFPVVGAVFLRSLLFFDKIVALSLLPILFIAFGIDELSKIMLIVIGVAPTVLLDSFNLTKGVPNEQVVKALTLGARDSDVAYRVVLKQILPRVINSIRLNLKAIVLFLFAGEMIAATEGLAYRIALLRRHMGMDLIIPYVLWVALLVFIVDMAMRWGNQKLHPWFKEA